MDLSSLALQVTAGLDLLDSSGDLIADISDDLNPAGSSVSRNNNARVHGTCRLNISQQYLWESQRFRPYMTVTDLTDDTSQTWYLGVYLLETPERIAGESPQTYRVEGYDLLRLLDSPYGSTYRVASGTGYVSTVEALISAAGGTSAIDQTSTATLPADRVWQIDEQNTTLRIVNDLLDAIGYRAVWVDRTGVFRSEPYVSPANRELTYTYDLSSDTTMVADGATETSDLWSIPNRWVFVRDDPAQDLPSVGDGLYTVVNQSDGVTSVDSRGRTITRIVRLESADQTALVTQGDRIVEEDKQPIGHVDLSTSPNPNHWHSDVLSLTAPELGLSDVRFVEQSWTLPLDGGDMTHTLRRV